MRRGAGGARRGWWRGGLVALALGALAAPAVGAEPARGQLRTALWEARGAGESAAGCACWLDGAGGAWRADVARHALPATGEGVAWGRLLGRAGEGWTIVAGPEGAAAGRWGAPLEAPEPALLLRLRVAIALLEAGPVARPELPWPARLEAPTGAAGEASPGAPLRLRLPAQGSLRERLEARGRGRGGAGETWRVAWEPDRAGGRALVVRSSRVPGMLALRPAGAVTVEYDPLDAFVPLWGLGELLAFPDGRPAWTAEPGDGAPD